MKLTQVLPSVYQLVKFLFFIFSHRTKQDKGQRVFQNKNEIKTKNLKGFKPSLFRESKKRKKGMRKIKFLCSVLSSSQDVLEGKRFFSETDTYFFEAPCYSILLDISFQISARPTVPAENTITENSGDSERAMILYQ